jgi:hypothetical protein
VLTALDEHRQQMQENAFDGYSFQGSPRVLGSLSESAQPTCCWISLHPKALYFDERVH